MLVTRSVRIQIQTEGSQNRTFQQTILPDLLKNPYTLLTPVWAWPTWRIETRADTKAFLT
jgi:hypothetical protein